MKKFFKYVVERLQERSTWLGILTLITAAGAMLSPELQSHIINAGMSIVAIIAILTKDSVVIKDR